MRTIPAMFAIMLVLRGVPAAHAQSSPDRTDFTAEIDGRVAVEIGRGNVRILGPLRIAVTERNGAESRVLLDQTWKYCATRSVADCEEANAFSKTSAMSRTARRRAGSAGDLADMRTEVRREMARAPRPVSPQIYRFSQGRLVVVE